MAKLFGAAAALRDAADAPLLPVYRADYERQVAATRAALGEATFAAVWEEGRTMALEDALACALQDDAKG